MSSFLADAHTLSAAMKKTHHTPTATAPSKAYAACANEKGGKPPLHAQLFQEKNAFWQEGRFKQAMGERYQTEILLLP